MSTARGNSNGVDRLSSLCDELLHHMMSFLPMPEVVRTGVLSPRWRNLWASTPFIHIDQQDFKDETKRLRVDEHKLEKFGDHFLLLRDGTVCLDEARIFVFTSDVRSKSSLWIRYAIKHKVRLLHVSGLEPRRPSTSMFPSQHLKRIRLQSVCLFQKFFRPLNHDCPVLEHLELEHCNICDVKEISSRSLKVLHVIRCFIVDSFLICAVNLTSVILSSEEFHFDTQTVVDGHHLLGGLSHAATLELHAPLHELAFERDLQACPMFSNLTSLVLGDWCTAADFYPLLRILQCSSKLRELNLKLNMEECNTCKDSEYDLPSSGGLSSGTVSYPSIESIKICCLKDDPRVGVVVQAL